jgi:chaperonin GroEL (HSP60 family)
MLRLQTMVQQSQKEMDVEHPAAKMMVEVAKSVDSEVGDGTTSSAVLAGALLEKAEDLINKNIHPSVVVEGYEAASEQTLKLLRKKIRRSSLTKLKQGVSIRSLIMTVGKIDTVYV